MAKRTPYPERIIRDYYRNQDTIMLQRLGDLVADLYLAEGPARARLWKRAGETLRKLQVPAEQIQHLVQSGDPALLLGVLKQISEKKK
jgi:hypothetical protein